MHVQAAKTARAYVFRPGRVFPHPSALCASAAVRQWPPEAWSRTCSNAAWPPHVRFSPPHPCQPGHWKGFHW
eukprot:10678584-Alexandrium_andersonii.AAC.1